ncbi:MAG: hypothetical protein WA421_08925 [Nitrososphaeraceae archaeon]
MTFVLVLAMIVPSSSARMGWAQTLIDQSWQDILRGDLQTLLNDRLWSLSQIILFNWLHVGQFWSLVMLSSLSQGW